MIKAANVGPIDRLIRLVVGVTLILLPTFTDFALWQEPLAAWGLPIVGIVLVATAILRFCPAYRLIGVKTCRTA